MTGRRPITKALKVAKREYLAQVKTKGFIIGLLVAPVFMSGSAIAYALLKDRIDTTDRKIAVVDYSGIVAPFLIDAVEARNAEAVYDSAAGRKIRPAYLIEVIEPGEQDLDKLRLELSNRVRSNDLHAFLMVGEGILHPRENRESAYIDYHGENAAIDEVRGWMNSPINYELRRLRLVDADIDMAAIEDLFDWITPVPLSLVSADAATGEIGEAQRTSELEAILIPAIFLMLMFLLVMWGAMPLLSAVMEEKSQRIAEVILGSVRPFQFMMGKLFGGVGVSLTVATVYVVIGIVALRHMDLGGYIPYHLIPWLFVYVVVAILMFGALLASLGAACNDITEAQAVQFPAMIPMMIPMFVTMPVVNSPTSSFATLASLIPPFTPMLMLLRQATPGGVPAWQPLVGLAGTILFTLFLIWAGGRIFRVAILMQGMPPKFSNFVKWAIRG